jgi:TatD DNase family protein
VHCYTDPSPHHLRDLLDLDCYIGITGWIADPRRGVELADLVAQREIPQGRLMIETDAPFLIPHNRPKVVKGDSTKGRKGAREMNEPALLGWVAKKVAECLDISVEELAKETTTTAKEFFKMT